MITRVWLLVVLFLATLTAARAEVDQDTKGYILAIQDLFLKPGMDMTSWQNSWKELFQEHLDLDSIGIEVLGPQKFQKNNSEVRGWLVRKIIGPQSTFMDVIKQSVAHGFASGPCQVEGENCRVVVVFSRPTNPIRLELLVSRPGGKYILHDIDFEKNTSSSVRAWLLKQLHEANANGKLAYKN